MFGFGTNSNGCLGLGPNNAFEKTEIVMQLCDQQIIDIAVKRAKPSGYQPYL